VAERSEASELPLASIVAASREETNARLRGEPHTEVASAELFRRALVLDQSEAWAAIIEVFRGTVVGVARQSAATLAYEDEEFLVNRTFERFWMAAGRKRYGQSANLDLASSLKYLKMCATSVLMDEARARRRSPATSLDDVPKDIPAPSTTEQATLGRLATEQLWQSLRRELRNEAEEVAYLSVVHDLRPAEIFVLRPDLFESVADVTRVKRGVLSRLRRSPTIRTLLVTDEPHRSATTSGPATEGHTPPSKPRGASPVSVALPERVRAFLCHSSGDKPVVRELYTRLASEKWIVPWLDEEDLLPGQKWEDEIRRAVRTAHVVIVCLSRASISRSGYVHKEIGYALDEADKQPEDTIFLIPLRLDDCEVPERLKGLHWVNYHDQTGYDRLLRALKRRAQAIGVAISS
jgi:DNA-directed RNA polymerase specialized sigma24 family protein